jgi:prepilin-type N-terminal cleavage/methylation domain-containing protein/prepilin-type processing-associated H-X9-DG protein
MSQVRVSLLVGPAEEREVMTSRIRRFSAGFTLVELLVVIGIIALLISILLPTLGRARKVANTIKCAANLRSILQGMQIYASQNNGAIPGGPHTSARYVYVDPGARSPQINTAYASPANYQGIITIFDWMSPIAKIMAVRFEEGGTDAERVRRFDQLRSNPSFNCPENQFLARPFGTPSFPVGPMVSYNTALVFHLNHNPGGGAGIVGVTIGRTDWNPPPGYSPKLTKIGNGSRKVYIADGGRYSNAGTAPDASLAMTGSLGGPFADQGPAMRFSNSWDRSRVPGNSPHPQNPGTTDARTFAYRHGQSIPGGRGDTYRFNVGFFDGHVETLGDLEGANPTYWYPKGTSLNVVPAQMHADVIAKYFNGQTNPAWIVP